MCLMPIRVYLCLHSAYIYTPPSVHIHISLFISLFNLKKYRCMCRCKAAAVDGGAPCIVGGKDNPTTHSYNHT